MGRGLWEIMEKYMEVINVAALCNKRLAINGHLWLWDIIRGNVPNSSLTVKPHLSIFYNRCAALMENGIEPVVVFDNIEEISQNDLQQNNAILKKCRKNHSGIWAREMKCEVIKQIQEIKILLNAMGVRWLASKLEGEAQCAQLEQRGIVHGCITRNIDYLLYGGSNLYQIEFSGTNRTVHNSTLLLSMDRISDKLCISRSGLIAMSIMIGCDYNQRGINGVGAVSALEILSEFYIMKQDHPQVILDRFISYVTGAVPVRLTDSEKKKKLKEKCEKNFIDVRNLHPNTETFSNLVNAYLTPCVVEYTRADVPKKRNSDDDKVQEILSRECNWNPFVHQLEHNDYSNKCSKSKNALLRHESIVALLNASNQAHCSKRESLAIDTLRNNASHYQYCPKIEVVSILSTSEEITNNVKEKSVCGAQKRSGKRKSNGIIVGTDTGLKRVRELDTSISQIVVEKSYLTSANINTDGATSHLNPAPANGSLGLDDVACNNIVTQVIPSKA